MADVGSIVRVSKIAKICFAVVVSLGVLGCSGGTISSDTQVKKADAIHKWVEDHKDPNAPRRGEQN